jgi:hypothetical protein
MAMEPAVGGGALCRMSLAKMASASSLTTELSIKKQFSMYKRKLGRNSWRQKQEIYMHYRSKFQDTQERDVRVLQRISIEVLHGDNMASHSGNTVTEKDYNREVNVWATTNAVQGGINTSQIHWLSYPATNTLPNLLELRLRGEHTQGWEGVQGPGTRRETKATPAERPFNAEKAGLDRRNLRQEEQVSCPQLATGVLRMLLGDRVTDKVFSVWRVSQLLIQAKTGRHKRTGHTTLKFFSFIKCKWQIWIQTNTPR